VPASAATLLPGQRVRMVEDQGTRLNPQCFCVLERVAYKRQLCHMPVHTPKPARKEAYCPDSGPVGRSAYGMEPVQRRIGNVLITLMAKNKQKHNSKTAFANIIRCTGKVPDLMR